MQFSGFESTISPYALVNSITQHGTPAFHTSDSNLADIVAVYKQSDRFYIVGIAISELNATVRPKLVMEYLEKYRHTCEYFYLAAKRFSQSTLELKEIGLFDLTKMKVIKNPEYLSIDPEFKSIIMRGVKKHFQTLSGEVENPFQRTLGEF